MSSVEASLEAARSEVRSRPIGFLDDVAAIAGRALRSILREPEFVAPALVIPVFFFFVNTGALQGITENLASGFDYKAFVLPACIIFGVTGISRAGVLVIDIQSGYLDRLLLSPVHRLALLLGMMVADIALVSALTVPLIGLGLVAGVRFETGLLGIAAFIVLSAVWGLVFTGFPYAIALKTGNPAAVNTSFLLFFPFAFLTTSFVPRGVLSGWLEEAAKWNPVTYVLEGMRSLVSEGWNWNALGRATVAISAVGLFAMWLCFAALRGRLKRG